jgi:sec-independent protein translocase protein TatB
MFDISWTEFLLIGVIALIVIGPKELPTVMRTLGQYTRKIRSMASDFQNQFQEAMREAEMTDLKKQVDDLAQDVKDLNPLKGVRDDLVSAGEDVKRSLNAAPEPAAALPDASVDAALTQTAAEPPVPVETVSLPPAEAPVPTPPEAPSEQPAGDMETIGAGAQATATEPVDKAAQTGTERAE